MKRAIALALLFSTASLCAQDAGAPFGRAPSDPVSSFAIRDKAGNQQIRMERPAQSLATIEDERCLPKTRLCFSINERDGEDRPLLRMRVHGGEIDRSLPLDVTEKFDSNLTINDPNVTIWPLAIHRAPHEGSDAEGEAVIIGVEATDRLSFSGGGAHTTVLWLYRIDNAGTANAVARQVLSVPLDAERSINACFNKKDEKARHNACIDQTSVQALLVLDADNTEPMPKLNYRVETGTYPSDIPLRQPEDVPKQLTKRDLVHARHPDCSYERKVAWNPATARFEFDRPAPDCRIFGLQR